MLFFHYLVGSFVTWAASLFIQGQSQSLHHQQHGCFRFNAVRDGEL